jgi:hypothetical protein
VPLGWGCQPVRRIRQQYQDNVKLLCRTCNRKKKANPDPKLFVKDPVGRVIDALGIADEEETLSDLRHVLESRKRKKKA